MLSIFIPPFPNFLSSTPPHNSSSQFMAISPNSWTIHLPSQHLITMWGFGSKNLHSRCNFLVFSRFALSILISRFFLSTVWIVGLFYMYKYDIPRFQFFTPPSNRFYFFLQLKFFLHLRFTMTAARCDFAFIYYTVILNLNFFIFHHFCLNEFFFSNGMFFLSLIVLHSTYIS